MHNSYDLAPDTLDITAKKLSPYVQDLAAIFDFIKLKKIVPNLHDKHKYIRHCRNFKLYIELGLNLIQVHRVLKFKQKSWLK